MAQDEQLDVLGLRCAAEQHQPADEPIEDQVEEAERHIDDYAWSLVNADHRTSRAQADFWNPPGLPSRGASMPREASPLRAAEQAVLVSGEHREPAAAHPELHVDRPDVALDGVDRHGEVDRDLVEREQ
jgi:hypothetical protein